MQPRLNLRVEEAEPAARPRPGGEAREEAADSRAQLDAGRTGLRERDRAGRNAGEQPASDRIAAADRASGSTASSGRPKRRRAGPAARAAATAVPSGAGRARTRRRASSVPARASTPRPACARRPALRSTTGAGKLDALHRLERPRHRPSLASSARSRAAGDARSSPLVRDALGGSDRVVLEERRARRAGASAVARAGPASATGTRRASSASSACGRSSASRRRRRDDDEARLDAPGRSPGWSRSACRARGT